MCMLHILSVKYSDRRLLVVATYGRHAPTVKNLLGDHFLPVVIGKKDVLFHIEYYMSSVVPRLWPMQLSVAGSVHCKRWGLGMRLL